MVLMLVMGGYRFIEDEEVAMMVVILKTSLSLSADTTMRMTMARMVAMPPHAFFMNPSPSILQKAECGNMLREASLDAIY